MQIGFHFNQSRCVGCYTCVVACKDWHDVPAGPASWIRVATLEKGTYPDVSVSFMCTPCYHCAEPSCIAACPVNAITKREEDGIVVVDRDTCLGKDNCQMCLEACPYDAPQFGAEENAKMQKCDLCLDRLSENKDPICVAACPLRALDAGPIEELRAEYGDTREAEGFAYASDVEPSVVFTRKNSQRPSS